MCVVLGNTWSMLVDRWHCVLNLWLPHQLVLLDVVSQTLFSHALQSKRQAYDRQLQEAKEAEAAMVNSFKEQVSICKMLKLCILE